MTGLEAIQELGKEYQTTYSGAFERARIIVPVPIGYLRHEPTKVYIHVYQPIGRFKRLMLRWCFGLRYVKRNTTKQ